jgi:hypothetical protein
MDEDIYSKIIKRKQFSQLKKIDVEIAWKSFEKRQVSEEEKIKLTRDLLGRSQIMFTSKRFLKSKLFEEDWILKRHVSTSERYNFYDELYSRIFGKSKEKSTVFDLGAGINGFSYKFLPSKIKYFAIESIGQLVEIQNKYFESRSFNAKAIHESLFDLDKITKIILKEKGRKVMFLFKVIDSLEILEKNYSKKLLLKLIPLVDKVVVSFATRSLVKKSKFKATRNWIYYFIEENFQIIDDFELGNERYISFRKE